MNNSQAYYSSYPSQPLFLPVFMNNYQPFYSYYPPEIYYPHPHPYYDVTGLSLPPFGQGQTPPSFTFFPPHPMYDQPWIVKYVDGELIIDATDLPSTSRSQTTHVDEGEIVFVMDEMDQQDEVPVSNRLTKTQIDENLKPLLKTCEREEQEDCSICLCELEENRQIVVLTCQHKYHMNCIHEWLGRKNVCPLCKRTALTV